ncbi:hypothetical protein E3N88_07974 [Mikania micrantha]|uniref:Rx N-terminal domain-containing protein n=1 Tax=Mikania micrantha TaxID=192012 RepID=A0A5N6PEY1_9ASTR|nr:hypothetical protein E3N88_07974 [Mikania micrantha]
MAEVVVSAVLSVLFENLTSEALKTIARYKGIDAEIKKLHRLLTLIQDVLADASRKEITSQSVKRWLNDFQHLAYDIEDVLDELATGVMEREFNRESEAISRKVRKLIPCCCSNFSKSTKMLDKLDRINDELQELLKQKAGLGLCDEPRPRNNKNRRFQSSVVDPSRIVGRKAEKEALVQQLLQEDEPSHQSFGIVPIFGMGGVGKTTLARLLYDDQRVKEHFELKGWVCISDDFDIFGRTKDIFKSVGGELKKEHEDFNKLHESLRDYLRGEKFLLVLDDVWCESYPDWQTLVEPLCTCAQGSKILITTRKDQLLKRAKEDEDSWKGVFESEIWNLPVEGEILPALRLSYHELSAPLKHTAPCSPRISCLTKRNSFYYGWQKGFCTSQLKAVQKKKATHVAGEFFVRLDIEAKKDINERMLEKYCHMSFVCEEFVTYKKLEAFKRSKNLRTFLATSVGEVDKWQVFYLSNKIVVDLLSELPLLRVLSLTKLPKSFLKLKNLRHLDIRETWCLDQLPLRIGELKSLQTLSRIIIGGGSGFKITELKDLENLCGEVSIVGLDKVQKNMANFPQKRLSKLEVVWSDMWDGSRNEMLEKEVLNGLKPHSDKLIKLEIRLYGGLEFPKWLQSLKELFIEDLERVKVVGMELLGTCRAFPSLEILSFNEMHRWEKWSTDNREDVYLNVWYCDNLVSLGEKKYDDDSNLQIASLRKLIVYECNNMEHCNCTDSIETLSFIGCSSITSISLPTRGLKSLYISRCNKLLEKEWGGQNNNRMLLEDVYVGDWPNLKSIMNLNCLVHLTRLEIDNCEGLESFPDNELPNLTLLKRLRMIKCPNLTSLKHLGIRDCPRIDGCFPRGLWPPNLQTLEIGRLKKPISEWGSQSFPNSLVE